MYSKKRKSIKFNKKIVLSISAAAIILLIVASLLAFKPEYTIDYGPEYSSQLEAIGNEINSLKSLYDSSPDNKTLQLLLLKKYYGYDLTVSKASRLRPGNEPYLLINENINQNSGKAIILVHGFTASPWETRELGEFLHKNGFTVYGIRLFGHGTGVEQLKYSEWGQWYHALEYSYQSLKYYSPNVYVGGVSIGGGLSFLLAKNHPDIKGVVSLGTPVDLQNKQSKLAFIAKYFMDYSPAASLTDEEKLYYYDKRAVAGVAEIYRAIDAYKKGLKNITQPVLILQAKNDPTVQPVSAEIISSKLASVNKKIIYYDEDKHVLIKSNSKEKVFNDILEFLQSN